MTTALSIRGAGGGSAPKAHTPVESPDNLRSVEYFRILDLISEGEIGGLVNGQQSIYLDETPLANDDGTSNFPRAHIEERTGTQDQDYIPGFDAVENEISIGVELKYLTPWIRSISDTQLSAVRVTIGVPALSHANTTNGDITGWGVGYTIAISTDGGAFAQVYSGSISGKTTTKYQRSHRLDLPAATTGWQIRVSRTSANGNSSAIADTTTIDSYTEIVDAKLRYPNSALVGVMGDASQFSNIPSRSYDCWGRIIKVPSNYDPQSRVYTGTWDGTFKPAWTDNPAWVFYDLVLHSRYGLGHLVSAAQVDKWELYRIAQYCDQPVSDGKGGFEPRFSCNLYLQSQADAYKLLNDLSSIFRGISYWAGGAIVARADMPSDPTYTYTNANVIDGKFTYSSSSRKTRFTTALVTWNDPLNFYRSKVEYVEDRDGIARYGIQQTTLTAVGCTSQGQAQRIGRWLLLTSRLETDTCTFSVGLDGTIAAPGQIIRIADAARAGKRHGGRVHGATTTVVTVDKAPTVAAGDTLTVNMGDGTSQSRTVDSVSGNAITVTSAFTAAPATDAVWTVESTELAAQTFRVLAVTEDKSDSDISFTLTCLQHNASKFAAIDTGTIIQVPPISALTPKVQAAPGTVTITEHPVIVQGIASITLTIGWAAAKYAVSYDVEWRKDQGQWISSGNISGLSVDVVGVRTGDYQARVRARNSDGDASVWAYANGGEPVSIVGKVGSLQAPTLTAIGQLFALKLLWQFSTTQNQTDNAYTEVKYNTANDFASALDYGQFPYPVNMAVIDGMLGDVQLWAWVRVVDKSGNTSNWVSATATTGSVDLLFEPVLEITDALRADVDKTMADVFPQMAGSGAYAGDTTLYAGVWSEKTQRAEADNLMSQDLELLGARSSDKKAFILNMQTTKVDDTTSLAQYVNSVQADFGPINARVDSEILARSTADDAFASSLSSVSATAAGNTASVTTLASAQATTAGKVNASYTMVLDSNGYIAGWKFQNDGTTGDMAIAADKFSIVSPSGTAQRTEYSGGNWRVYDSSGTLRVRLGVW